MPDSLFIRVTDINNDVVLNSPITLAYPSMILAQYSVTLKAAAAIPCVCIYCPIFQGGGIYSTGTSLNGSLLIPVDGRSIAGGRTEQTVVRWPHITVETQTNIPQTFPLLLSSMTGVPLSAADIESVCLWFTYEGV